MQARHQRCKLRHLRLRGFSVLELLVVLGVISLLMSLLLPAVLRARGSSRRLTCQNNLRQISLAMIMHVDLQGRYPAAGYFSATGATKYHNWVTAILPQLEQSGLASQYDLSKPYDDDVNFELTRTPLPVLVCPDDISLVRGEGNLSYVVNGGIGWTIPDDCPASLHFDDETLTIFPLDLNGDGNVCEDDGESGDGPSDLHYLEQLSLFFVENWPLKSGTVRFHRPADVTDGLTNTLLLSENIRAGFDPEVKSSWGTPEPLRNLFLISSEICPDGTCQEDQIDLSRANDRSDSAAGRECLNASINQAEGAAPWPSSGHPGLVHVAWADGHVTVLSELVDAGVYFAMVTPRGTQGEGPFAEPVMTGQNR